MNAGRTGGDAGGDYSHRREGKRKIGAKNSHVVSEFMGGIKSNHSRQKKKKGPIIESYAEGLHLYAP